MRERKEKRKGTEGAAVDINSKFGPFFFLLFFCFFLFFPLRGGQFLFSSPVNSSSATFLSARCSDHPANETTEENPPSKV